MLFALSQARAVLGVTTFTLGYGLNAHCAAQARHSPGVSQWITR